MRKRIGGGGALVQKHEKKVWRRTRGPGGDTCHYQKSVLKHGSTQRRLSEGNLGGQWTLAALLKEEEEEEKQKPLRLEMTKGENIILPLEGWREQKKGSGKKREIRGGRGGGELTRAEKRRYRRNRKKTN